MLVGSGRCPFERWTILVGMGGPEGVDATIYGAYLGEQRRLVELLVFRRVVAADVGHGGLIILKFWVRLLVREVREVPWGWLGWGERCGTRSVAGVHHLIGVDDAYCCEEELEEFAWRAVVRRTSILR